MKKYMRFLVSGLIAVFLIALFFSRRKLGKGHGTGDIAIIGGADGPTAIIINKHRRKASNDFLSDV